MKKKILMTLGILVAVLALGAFLLRNKINQYIPGKERAELSKVLQVSGEQTAIFLNEELMFQIGLTRDGQTYLPISLVNNFLNEKFYWDDTEKLLVYTLPETIVYADKRTMGTNGLPLLLAEKNEVYLSVDLVAGYTPLEQWNYSTGDVKRIYLDTALENRKIAFASKKTPVREKGGIKSLILTEVNPGDKVYLLEEMEEWAKVRTPDGNTGYLKKKYLEKQGIEQPQETTVVPEYTSISLGEPVCMVFHQVTLAQENGRLKKMMENSKGVNVVAPTWFSLIDSLGNYESFADRSYVDLAHEMGMQVWVVLENVNHTKEVDNKKLFCTTSSRKTLIENLMMDVETYGIDGINLDIEGLKTEAGNGYVQFIRELSVACRQKGIILSVDNYVPSPYTAFYNRSEQGRVADYVVIMGYDEHYAGGDAGSVASYGFVKDGIEDTIEEVPKEKVINAMPFYTRVWTVKGNKTSSKAYSMAGAEKWVQDNGIQLKWLEEEKQYYGEKNSSEGKQMIWMEEERSFQAKLDLAKKNGIAGNAFWKLGLEKDSVWDLINPSN